jgi:hypothetical protein
VDLGKTLTRVLSLRSAEADPAQPAAPIEAVSLQGKPFSVPFETQRIAAPAFLAGKTVVEAITTTVTVCFTTGLLFQDDFLSMYHGKEARLADELRRRMALVENLLDPDSFAELSALYS